MTWTPLSHYLSNQCPAFLEVHDTDEAGITGTIIKTWNVEGFKYYFNQLSIFFLEYSVEVQSKENNGH